MRDLKNKNILVTGGARGIGKQIAVEFARRGANIIICDSDRDFIDGDDFRDSIKDIEVYGVTCLSYYLDVIDIDTIKKFPK